MAVTGIRGVTGDLKRSIAYITNREKTEGYTSEDPEENRDEPEIESGTVRYVAGINCSTQRAYEEMTAIQEQYDRPGHNVAYHGYQSFREGEISPEEAFEICKETARILWGRDYQVLVSIHTNTSHIHGHFLINSVSFTTHRKFENSKQDMKNFRAVSDRLCLQHEKTIVRHPKMNPPKNVQRYRERGGRTEMDYMLDEIRTFAKITNSRQCFAVCLSYAGYQYDYERAAICFPGKRHYTPLNRFPGLGRNDLPRHAEYLWQWEDEPLPISYPKTFAVQKYISLLAKDIQEEPIPSMDFAQVVDCMVRSLEEYMENRDTFSILSPELRAQQKNITPLTELRDLLVENKIHTHEEFISFAQKNTQDLKDARAERDRNYQCMYHVKDPELKREHEIEYSASKEKVEKLTRQQKTLERFGENPNQMASRLQHFSTIAEKELLAENDCSIEMKRIETHEKEMAEARERARNRDRGYER